MATFQDAIKEAYPNRRQRTAFEAGVQFGPGAELGKVDTSARVDGYLFTSLDGRQIVQARLDGFTFNRLRPYERWDRFRDEARALWDRYRELTSPLSISRVALRYINRIELPTPLGDFKEYVLTTPEIAPGLPQGLAGFFMRLMIPLERFGCLAVITETMEEPKANRVPYILDIDVSVTNPFPPEGEDVWATLERLREAKNEVFFRSITPKTVELCK